MNHAIKVKDLKKSFKVKRNKTVEAVRSVSLSVEQCEIFGFPDPNGAGKTTCQRMLTTLLPIDSGTVAAAELNAKKQPDKVRRHIGYVSQLGGGI
jgi:ABC-2 type transport system ATP-binding protein